MYFCTIQYDIYQSTQLFKYDIYSILNFQTFHSSYFYLILDRRVSILDWLKSENQTLLHNSPGKCSHDSSISSSSSRESNISMPSVNDDDDNKDETKEGKNRNKAWKFASKPAEILNMKTINRDHSTSSINSVGTMSSDTELNHLSDEKYKINDDDSDFSPSSPSILDEISDSPDTLSSNNYDDSSSVFDESPRPLEFPKLNNSDSSSSFHHQEESFHSNEDELQLIETPQMVYSVSGDSKQKIIFATTLKGIIEEITSISRNRQLLNDFITCLPFIASPSDVVNVLSERFENPLSDVADILPSEIETRNFNIKKQVVALLQEWIDTNFKYFLEPQHIATLYKFIKQKLRQPTDHSSQSSSSSSQGKSRKSRLSSSLSRNIFISISDVMLQIIHFKFASIDPKDLLPLVLRMKNPKGGVRTFKKSVQINNKDGTVTSEEYDVFLGSDAIKWLKKIHDEALTLFNEAYRKKEQHLSSIQSLLELDYVEIFNLILKDGYITTLQKSKNSESSYTFKKNKKYIFCVPKDKEEELTLKYMKLSNNLFRRKEEILQIREKKFTMIDPDVFAQHLSFYELNLFKRIETHELHYWIKGDKRDVKRKRMAPNLYNLITFVNHMSLWISTEIVSENDPFTRAAIVKKFLLIADKCLEYRNYQGLLEISLGLTSSSVQRLKAWRRLEKEYVDIYSKISEIMSPIKNWKNYREQIDKDEDKPCVPYVGLYLSDLTFIQDGIPSQTKDGMINWKKIMKINAIMKKIKQIQLYEYNFKLDSNVMRFLLEETVKVDEKTLYEISLSIEPKRGRSNSIF